MRILPPHAGLNDLEGVAAWLQIHPDQTVDVLWTPSDGLCNFALARYGAHEAHIAIAKTEQDALLALDHPIEELEYNSFATEVNDRDSVEEYNLSAECFREVVVDGADFIVQLDLDRGAAQFERE